MNITLCGYGVVGKGVEKLCELTNDLNIQYIYVRKEKEDLPVFQTKNISLKIHPLILSWNV